MGKRIGLDLKLVI